MTISRLELTDFTVFKKASFEFCPGINVLIGENGTGKSHVLKAMYAVVRAAQEAGARRPSALLYAKFAAVFRVDLRTAHRRLVRRGATTGFAVQLVDVSGASTSLKNEGETTYASHCTKLGAGLFVPPREVLAMYRGFIAAYEGRKLDLDETYPDLCKAMSATPPQGPRARVIEAMLAPLEQILGGEVVLAGDRFVIRQPDGDTEAHLVAEGLRKIASLAHLVANGSLTAGSVLFWDEPEASLNPGLVVKIVDFLRTLAASGVQVFLASHDFLLVHRLSQTVEYGVDPAVPVRFISLFRPEPGAPVEVEQGDTLVDIEHNAILDEFARYYDREQVLAAKAMHAEEAPTRQVTSKVEARRAPQKNSRATKKQTKAPQRKAAKKVARA
jgi:energy-coupling factor transporter ATP-binding protein EcfA2